jgi:hypothetical protein
MRFATAIAAALSCFALAAVALAQTVTAPPNDNRANAQSITPPASLSGTTVGATREVSEPGSSCGGDGGSVWYQFTASQDARIVADFQASGDLDAAVDVFHRVRSQLGFVTCDQSDSKGRASVSFRVKKGEAYLIRVAQLSNSVSDQFKLDVLIAQPPARPPGSALPAGGASGTLDRTAHTTDAWAVRLAAGRTYRINALRTTGGCMSFGIYRPHIHSFESSSPAKQLNCGGYTLFTPGPGQSGVYSILVSADSVHRGQQRYRLQVAPARRDDTAPGIFAPNYARMHGSLAGSHIDVADLYRFTIAHRSSLKVKLRTRGDFVMSLYSLSGRRLTSASGELDWSIKPGRYFIQVRARGASSGRYTLQRISRAVTKTRVSIKGRHRTTALPGVTIPIGVTMTPSVAGPVTIDVQRFDPVHGWQFFHRYSVRAHQGIATVSFRPPSVGRWRAKASFDGTRSASPSASGFAEVLVARPLPT